MLISAFYAPVVADLGLASELEELAKYLNDESAATLFKRLFEPFDQKLLSAKVVYLAPDGFLNLIPFVRLRVCPERSDGIAEFSEHEAD
jgi:hypothetical protein